MRRKTVKAAMIVAASILAWGNAALASEQCPDTPPACPTVTPCPVVTCELTALPEELWPPNHKFVAITFVDSEDNVVTPTITAVSQDEPTLSISSGNFCPDARISGSGALSLRSERAGSPRVPGDGRVYHIFYTVETSNGPCSGETTVCVPHDQRPGHVCVDQGPIYDSLTCSSES